MPLRCGDKLLSNRESLGKMSMAELKAYAKALEDFMVSNSPMIAVTLKQCYQEIEWRNAEDPDRQT